MRVIVAGSRSVSDPDIVIEAIERSGFELTELLCGGCAGPDLIARDWAMRRDIPVRFFWAEWSKHGRSAGPVRNRAMAECGQALVAIWDGKSRGTADMIRHARKLGLKVYVHEVP